MFAKRIVVTGVGAVTPIGNDARAFWEALVDGRSGAGPLSLFPVGSALPGYAAEVKGFAAESGGLPRRKLKMMGRQAQLAFAAVQDAYTDSGLRTENGNIDRIGLGIILGVGMLNADVGELGRAFYATARASSGETFDTVAFGRAGAPELFPLWLLRHIPNLAAAHSSIALDAQGPSNTIATGCVAAANAIGEAARLIARGEAHVVIAGGTDARVSPLGTLRYRELGWLSTRDDVDPASVSAPFDAEATGFVNGEGAGVIVLESLEHASRRGARIYAELTGYGAANDAYDVLKPEPGGRALARAARQCLARGGMRPEDLDVVFAPAPSVPEHDRAIAAALVALFGEGSSGPAVTATRSLLGHTHAASAAFDCIAAVKAIDDSRIPPTRNLEHPIADLPFVTGPAKEGPIDVALVGAYGFGGHGAALAFRRYAA